MLLFVKNFRSFWLLNTHVPICRSQNFESKIGMFVGFSQIKRTNLYIFLPLLLILFHKSISFDLSIGTFWTSELIIHKLWHLQSSLTLCVFVSFEILAFVDTVLELSQNRSDGLDIELYVGRGGKYELVFVVGVGVFCEAVCLYFKLFEAAIILHVIYW